MERFSNNARSTLASGILAGDASLTVASAATFPNAPNFRLKIDSEIMLVTAVAGNTFTVTRAQESTVAAAHSAGATVSHVLTAASLLLTIQENTALPNGTSGQILTSDGASDFGTAISHGSVGAVLRQTGATTAAFGQLDLADADAVTGTLPVGNGGTGLAAAGTEGNVLTSTGSGWTSRTPPVVFDNDTPLVANNITNNRTDSSPIDNTKVGITNFGSDTTALTTGVTADYATNLGGDQNVASETYTVVGGYKCQALGQYCVALGNLSIAGSGVNPNSFAIGDHCNATGAFSVAMGNTCQATGNTSFAYGESAVASGDYSMALGLMVEAQRTGQIVIGVNPVGYARASQKCFLSLIGISGAGVAANLTDFDGAEFDLTHQSNPAKTMGYSMNVRVFMNDRAGGGARASFVYEVTAYYDGAAATLDDVTLIYSKKVGAASTWTAAISLNGNDLRVACTGDAGTVNVDCMAQLEWIEVGN